MTDDIHRVTPEMCATSILTILELLDTRIRSILIEYDNELKSYEESMKELKDIRELMKPLLAYMLKR